MVWINNPDLTSSELIDKWKITRADADRIVSIRDSKYGGQYKYRHDVPLRHRTFFRFISLNPFWTEGGYGVAVDSNGDPYVDAILVVDQGIQLVDNGVRIFTF